MLAPAAAKRMATMAGMTKFMGSASPATTVSTPEAIIAYPPNAAIAPHLVVAQAPGRAKAEGFVSIGFRHDVAADDEGDARDEGRRLFPR